MFLRGKTFWDVIIDSAMPLRLQESCSGSKEKPGQSYLASHRAQPLRLQIVLANSAIGRFFTDSLKVLFGSLGTWNDSSDRSDRGLTLELSAYSPSDAEHFFKEYDFTHNPYSDPPGNFQATLADRTHPKFHDLNHLWESGRRVSDDQRVFSNCLHIHGLKGLCIVPPNYDDSPPFSAKRWLPEVGIVTKLLIRRQNYRLIHPDGLGQILERLKGLQDVVCETPQIPSHQTQARFDSRKSHCSCLFSCLQRHSLLDSKSRKVQSLAAD